MTTSTNSEPENLSPLIRVAFHDLIREQVIHRLGSPDNLLGVDVRPLWGNHYRVNVRAGAGFTSGRVSNSFFLVIDGDGKILESRPDIVRRY